MRITIAVAFLVSMLGVARGQTAAAILLVEDSSHPERLALTEGACLAIYGTLLRAGPYAEVAELRGRDDATARLAAKIVELAPRHAVIDLWLGIHSFQRDAQELQRLVPPSARKVRLVYVSGCWGARQERPAWEAIGATTVVTHTGLNYEMFGMPCALARWIEGDPIGLAVSTAWTDLQRTLPFTRSLPGTEQVDFSGSRPLVSGDAGLTVSRGLAGRAPRVPRALRWSLRTGGTPGLLLRALARAGFEGGSEELDALWNVLPGLPAGLEERVVRFRAIDGGDGALELTLKQGYTHPLGKGKVKLAVGRRVVLRLRRFDAEARRIVVGVDGVRIRVGAFLGAAIDGLALEPVAPDEPDDGDPLAVVKEGYRLRVLSHLGPIPVGRGFSVGGKTPPLLEKSEPLFAAIGEAIESASPINPTIPGRNAPGVPPAGRPPARGLAAALGRPDRSDR